MPSLARPSDWEDSGDFPPLPERPDPIKASFRAAPEPGCSPEEHSPRDDGTAVAAVPANPCMEGSPTVSDCVAIASSRRRRRPLPHTVAVVRRGNGEAGFDGGQVHVHPRYDQQVLAAGFHVRSYMPTATAGHGPVNIAMPRLAAGGPSSPVDALLIMSATVRR